MKKPEGRTLIIGGYGHVGKLIGITLSREYSHPVIGLDSQANYS